MNNQGKSTSNNKGNSSHQRNKQTQNKSAINNTQGLICSGCGTGINQAVKTFSMQKYGKPLCIDCQKKQ